MIQNQQSVMQSSHLSKQSLPQRFFAKYSSVKKPQRIACRIDEYRFLLCRNERIYDGTTSLLK